jgi:PCFT/HCP family folate transporter-like MFS transporter 1/3
MTSKNRKSHDQFITVEPVLFLFMFCALIDRTVLQQLAYRKICDVEYNHTTCHNLTDSQQNVVQKKTSNWTIYQSIAFTVSSICSSLVFGSWSDSVGRKSIMILPPIGAALMSVNHLLNIHFCQLDVNYLLVGVIVSGLFGGFATVLSAVFSYMSDITDQANRTLRIGMLESMVFLGASVGELVAGILLDNAGFMAAYGVVLAVNVCIVVYIVFVLQESYHPQEDILFSQALVKVHEHVVHVWTVLFKPRPENKRMYLLIVLLGGFGVIYISKCI